MCQHIGHNIIEIESTPSSNNYAIAQLRDNEFEEGTVFLAYDQTDGKGQLTNKWESEPGKNLTFSILLKPDFIDIRQQFMLSKVICLGIESVLSDYLDDVKVKWPNDIYVGKKKICGILIENSIMNGNILQSVVGIGLNVNQTKFISNAPNPISLKNATQISFDLKDLLKEVLASIGSNYELLRKGNMHKIDKSFMQKLYQLGEYRWYRDENHSYEGKILGVNEIGQLLIREQGNSLHTYHFKEVAYLTDEHEAI